MPTDAYVSSRRGLLDALEALGDQRDAVVLVGAQAIYLHTGEMDTPVAMTTKDSDLAVDPGVLRADPLLEETLKRAGFYRNLDGGQPGEWISAGGVPVDFLVPAALAPGPGTRGARIPPHHKHAMRKVAGLEGAVVDKSTQAIGSLEPTDARVYDVQVAGPTALLVAKLHKLGERAANPTRLENKDAHDIYRLLLSTDTADLAEGIGRLRSTDIAADAAEQAMRYLADHFKTTDALGPRLAGEAEALLGDPALVAASTQVLAQDLLVACGGVADMP